MLLHTGGGEVQGDSIPSQKKNRRLLEWKDERDESRTKPVQDGGTRLEKKRGPGRSER